MSEDSPFSPGSSQPGLGENKTSGENPSFAPPPSNVFIRTSDSDLNKLKSQGGEVGFNPPAAPSGPAFIPQPSTPPPPPTPTPSPNPTPSTPTSPPPTSIPNPTPTPTFSPPSPSSTPSSPITPTPSSKEPPSPGIPTGISTNNPPSGGITPPEVPASELSSFSSAVTPPSRKKSKSLTLLIIGGIIIAGVAFGYFYLWPKMLKPKPAPVVTITTTTTTKVPITTTTTIVSSPYPQISGPYQKVPFPVAIAGPTIVSAIKENALKETASPETFAVLIPKIHNDALTNEEVILSLIPKLPQRLKPYLLGRKYMLYTYYGKVNPSLGLIVNIGKDNQESVKSIFAAWEKGSILDDLSNFFLIKIPRKAARRFKENTTAGIEMHYFTYRGEEAAMTYAFFGRYLIISSSRESVNSAVSHLQGVTEPIIP